MNAGFTKGPWAAKTYGVSHPRFGIFAKQSVILARAWTEEDAHLIAAAPELYEALEIAAKRFREYERIHLAKFTEEGALKAANNADLAEHCERALEKARGESKSS